MAHRVLANHVAADHWAYPSVTSSFPKIDKTGFPPATLSSSGPPAASPNSFKGGSAPPGAAAFIRPSSSSSSYLGPYPFLSRHFPKA
eukprot:893699-Rhodomonas_salina.1